MPHTPAGVASTAWPQKKKEKTFSYQSNGNWNLPLMDEFTQMKLGWNMAQLWITHGVTDSFHWLIKFHGESRFTSRITHREHVNDGPGNDKTVGNDDKNVYLWISWTLQVQLSGSTFWKRQAYAINWQIGLDSSLFGRVDDVRQQTEEYRAERDWR